MSNDLTTLNVSPETWREINSLKDPGDTVDDVVQDLLEQRDSPKVGQ